MPDVTALRYATDSGNELDALVAVEVADEDAERGIDVILSPRQPEALTFSLSVGEARALARELARAAAALENGD